jgi:N-methylhydantoinase A
MRPSALGDSLSPGTTGLKVIPWRCPCWISRPWQVGVRSHGSMPGGLLRVGHRSAGADPGPVCYGRGEEITVTDANMFLGRVPTKAFLAGRMQLYLERVGLSARDAALGILRLVNTNMVRAIRAVSLERGHDPRGFVLVCFGGASGLHAGECAAELGIRRILLPARGGVFSAQGMAEADLVLERSQALFVAGVEGADSVIKDGLGVLVRALEAELEEMGTHPRGALMERALDVRYKGQSYELTVPLEAYWPERFSAEHRRLYGYDLARTPLEVTAIRCSARLSLLDGARVFQTSVSPVSGTAQEEPRFAVVSEKVPVDLPEGRRLVPVLARGDLVAGDSLLGPTLIVDDFTTILVPSSWYARALPHGHLLMECTDRAVGWGLNGGEG